MNLPMVKQLCGPFCFNAGAVVAGGERGRLQTTIGAGLLPSSPARALVSQWGGSKMSGFGWVQMILRPFLTITWVLLIERARAPPNLICKSRQSAF